MLYSSSALTELKHSLELEVLESKRVDITVYRLRTFENICFDLDTEVLQQVDQLLVLRANSSHASLSLSLTDADFNALSDQQHEQQEIQSEQYYQQIENRFSGQGMYIPAGEAIMPLVKFYYNDFNHTISIRNVAEVSDEIHHFTCNFTFDGKYYGIEIKFYSLRSLNDYAGHLSIKVDDEGISERMTLDKENPVVVYRLFNDTVVWINESDSWLTLEVKATESECCEDLIPVTVRIPPSAAWDERLGSRNDIANLTYSYQIKEYPWIEGQINYLHPQLCMDYDLAGSLYSQTDFPFKVPSYLPSGYGYKCMQASSADVSVFFANKTFDFEQMGEETKPGVIMLRMSDEESLLGIADMSMNDTERIIEQYQSIANANPALRPQLLDINGKAAWGNEASQSGAVQTVQFPDGSEISTVSGIASRLRFYDEGVSIHLEGYVTLEELLKIGESLKVAE
jgi:hypothetical protein